VASLAGRLLAALVGAVGIGLLALIVVTVALVARGRPAQPPRRRGLPKSYGRNMRAWQAGVLRDIRRRGR